MTHRSCSGVSKRASHDAPAPEEATGLRDANPASSKEDNVTDITKPPVPEKECHDQPHTRAQNPHDTPFWRSGRHETADCHQANPEHRQTTREFSEPSSPRTTPVPRCPERALHSARCRQRTPRRHRSPSSRSGRAVTTPARASPLHRAHELWAMNIELRRTARELSDELMMRVETMQRLILESHRLRQQHAASAQPTAHATLDHPTTDDP